MLASRKIFTVLLTALLFAFVFYHKEPGLNLLLFEFVLLATLIVQGYLRFKGKLMITTLSLTVLTSIATVFVYSDFAYTMNVLLFLLLGGIVAYPGGRNFLIGVILSMDNFLRSQFRFLRAITQVKTGNRRFDWYLQKAAIYLLPVIVILLFVLMYSASSPWFNDITGELGRKLNAIFTSLFEGLDMLWIFLFLFGLVLTIPYFFNKADQKIIDYDQNAVDELPVLNTITDRQHSHAKNESHAGVFLLIVLNLMILLLNVLDIYWVWFNYEWNGGYLKQFVHEGTYLLILSIIISIGIVLFFFRGKLNFIAGQALLKTLVFIWMAQNTVLVLSVGVRNIRYIENFALAYKRIGVFIFLLLTLYGILTVIVKVRHKKSLSYLLRKNAYALVLVLSIASLFNWDGIIARYNFKHADTSFIHFDFLSGLSDKTLPMLDKPLNDLQAMQIRRDSLFPYEYPYLNAEEYYEAIQYKKSRFIRDWESKDWLSWNYPEWKAYREIRNSEIRDK